MVGQLQLYTRDKCCIDATTYYRLRALQPTDFVVYALESPVQELPFVTQAQSTNAKPHLDMLFLHGRRQYRSTQQHWRYATWCPM